MLKLLTKLVITRGSLNPSTVKDAVAIAGERHASHNSSCVNVPIISHKFHVFKSFHKPLYLWLDSLQAYDGIFNTENNTLYVRDSDDTAYMYAIVTNTGLARVSRLTIIQNSLWLYLKCTYQMFPKIHEYFWNRMQNYPHFGLQVLNSLLTPKTTKQLFKWSIQHENG